MTHISATPFYGCNNDDITFAMLACFEVIMLVFGDMMQENQCYEPKCYKYMYVIIEYSYIRLAIIMIRNTTLPQHCSSLVTTVKVLISGRQIQCISNVQAILQNIITLVMYSNLSLYLVKINPILRHCLQPKSNY